MGAPGAARGRCGRRRGAGTAAPDPRTPSRRSATAPKVAKGVFSAPGSPALAAVLAPAATTSAARAPPAFASLRSPPAMTSNDAFPRRASLRRTEAARGGRPRRPRTSSPARRGLHRRDDEQRRHLDGSAVGARSVPKGPTAPKSARRRRAEVGGAARRGCDPVTRRVRARPGDHERRRRFAATSAGSWRTARYSWIGRRRPRRRERRSQSRLPQAPALVCEIGRAHV